MKTAYVAIGSNLGAREITTRSALAELQAHPGIVGFTVSHWYQSEAIGGPADQPDYLNAACCFQTSLNPYALLSLLQSLENKYGRTRDIRWGPRTLDLDIIWIDEFSSTDPDLIIPHPRAHKRAFVLLPLLDLKADFSLQNQSLHTLAEKAADQTIQRLPD